MTNVYIIADNIYSPLGNTAAENFSGLTQQNTGIKKQADFFMSDQPFYASLFNKELFLIESAYTKFEQLLIASIDDVLHKSDIDPFCKKTLLIISSTKGNISLLETAANSPTLISRIALHSSAKLVATHFNFVNTPLVVSNACISGLLGMITGMRMIQSGQYENVVVAGADLISKFVLSGFQSFQAISPGPCKPFDADRDGINLGEGAAAVVLSATKKNNDDIKISGGAVTNDANHISGPSRTGEELYQAIGKAMQDAGLGAAEIDFISAHGTATLYNDEMEAKAFTLANLQHVPINSLKGYYGHTLGAAGLIESVATIHSMKEELIIPTLGFRQLGVSQEVNICQQLTKKNLRNSLKTASGFGGCNAAIILSKQ